MKLLLLRSAWKFQVVKNLSDLWDESLSSGSLMGAQSIQLFETSTGIFDKHWPLKPPSFEMVFVFLHHAVALKAAALAQSLQNLHQANLTVRKWGKKLKIKRCQILYIGKWTGKGIYGSNHRRPGCWFEIMTFLWMHKYSAYQKILINFPW